MKSLLETTFYSLRNAFQRRPQDSEPWQSLYPDILTSLESVIDATDSRIRLVGGYRRKLQDAMRTALEFTEDLVGRIPAPIEVARSTFVSDPYVNAFFASVTDLQSVVSRSSEVREFLENCRDSQAPHCYGLLCMHKEEKTVLGMEIVGDMLRKDVRQVAVNFSDHRIYSPGPSETATRDGLKQCLFGGLVTNALERITLHKLAALRLHNERQMLHERLRHLEQKLKSAINDADRSSTAHDIEQSRGRLDTVERELLEIRPATPQESLEQVHAVFGQPESFVRMTKSALTLSKLGISLSDGSAGPCNRLELTEVAIGEAPPRVVTLAKFPREEFLQIGEEGSFSTMRS